jgi:ABC-type uncharacterized transport system auxiliary subunit
MAYLKRIKAAFIFGALGLGACVSVLPEPVTPDALYRISAATNGPSLNADIAIREPEAPRVMAGSALVSEDASGALRLIPGVEWAGPATRQFQLALVDSFSGDGAGAAVLPETGVAAQFELASRFAAFGLQDGKAVCQVTVDIINTRSRKLVASDNVFVSASAPSGRSSDRALSMKSVAEQCVSKVSSFAAASVESPN